MELTPEEKEICKKYSEPDTNGRVHCSECPLHFGDPKNGISVAKQTASMIRKKMIMYKKGYKL